MNLRNTLRTLQLQEIYDKYVNMNVCFEDESMFDTQSCPIYEVNIENGDVLLKF